MLIDTDTEIFRENFKTDPHQFISEKFTELNKNKVDRIVRLTDGNGTYTIGLVAGIKNNILKSPFSAPYGGFHFNPSESFIDEISNFINDLKEYAKDNNLQRIEITLPPDIYHHSVNAKFVNAFIRNGYNMPAPEITNWADLSNFDGTFAKREVMKNIRKAMQNNLSMLKVSDQKLRLEAYEIIRENRKLFNRPMHMTFDEIIETSSIIPIDFFLVKDPDFNSVGSAIFYRPHPKIILGTFWGDTPEGRRLRTMDFLALNLFNYYKKLGYNYIDLGISTKDGIPNQGLIRFKEIHNCVSSLRFSFFLSS